ncbi:MAG: response regulator [Jatrophihabitans sp.]|uniref:response regulator n=1 Tax=Jatrophihabitans sp. TaxID=1932789 RepID=UPI003F8108B1
MSLTLRPHRPPRPHARTARVFLVEDHEIVRRGVAEMLGLESDLEVVGEAANLRDARAAFATVRPDVVVLDIRLPDGSGLEFCREVRALGPAVHCVVFSSLDDRTTQLTAALAGASGYVVKDADSQTLGATIRGVARGHNYLVAEKEAALRALRSAVDGSRLGGLTAREEAVRQLLLTRHSDNQIAAELGIEPAAVRADVSSLVVKLIAPTITYPRRSAREDAQGRRRPRPTSF